MKKENRNPFLPLNEYIADGEPHVFDDRIYIFGSHDKADGDTYCMLDYVFWSANVDDLSDWSTKGVSYSAKQDPSYSEELKYMYAPDVVKGNDGRYYLYYCMSGYKGKGGYGQKISVAVCDTPDGKYEYYGFVRNKDHSPMLKYVTFDPSVINDNGTIRLYYGTWYPFHEYGKLFNGIFYNIESQMFNKSKLDIKSYKDGIMGANHVELDNDMLTIKTEPIHVFPNRVKGTSFSNHPFFEGLSVRKIDNTYYLIYSSTKGHELCYATSQFPDSEFVFGGTIVSNGDIGYKGRKPKNRLNATGTNHGSIEIIKDQWYVFYHRNTNTTAYSRQTCAEGIEILKDGKIPQVEITSQGLNSKPLKAIGTFPASICCNLTNGKMPHQGNGIIKKDIPYISCIDNGQVVIVTNNTLVGYKYFDFNKVNTISVTFKGDCSGDLEIKLFPDDKPLCTINLKPAKIWTDISKPIVISTGIYPLYFKYNGSGKLILKQFAFTN